MGLRRLFFLKNYRPKLASVLGKASQQIAPVDEKRAHVRQSVMDDVQYESITGSIAIDKRSGTEPGDPTIYNEVLAEIIDVDVI